MPQQGVRATSPFTPHNPTILVNVFLLSPLGVINMGCIVLMCVPTLLPSPTHILVNDNLHYKQSPDGKRVSLASETGQIYIFDLASNSLTATYTSHAMPIRSLAWSRDSNVRIIVPLHIHIHFVFFLTRDPSAHVSIHSFS